MVLKKRTTILLFFFIAYIVALLCQAVVSRSTLDSRIIETEFLRSYTDTGSELFWDNVFNVLGFIPVGLMLGLIVSRYRVVLAMLTGLFLSETIECWQLILQRGVFDVDDLFFNTGGALIGGLIVAIFAFIKRLKSRK